jgi:cell division protein FtsB
VELRMNRSAHEEYEEVESPYASPKTSNPRLRTRKNVFNRPMNTDSSVAPAVFGPTPSATRKSIGHPDMTDLIESRQSSLGETQISYLDEDEGEEVEEEEVVEKRPARTRTAPKKKTQKNVLQKIGWSVIGLLVLRLIFMDRGVWDYFSTENRIQEKRDELRSIQRENKELSTEISRIKLDKNYQRQLAKEHLGVIAADEFLILFAGEAATSDTEQPDSML